MKTIHWHVGSGRCGSTLIQSLFNEPTLHQVFAQNSLKYDSNIYLGIGNANLVPATEFDRNAWKPLRDEFFTPLNSESVENFFVTQENLFGVLTDKDTTNFCDVSCEAISYLAEDFHSKIVILIRRQDTFIESLYNQRLKRYESRTFQDFLDDTTLDNLNWHSVINTYANTFGSENVTVLPFEKKVLNTNGIDDFIAGVLAAIGVEQKIEFNNIPIMNPSLSSRVFDLQRLANQTLTEREAHGLADWFQVNIPKLPDDPYTLMSDADRKKVIDYFKESNEKMFKEYMPNYDPSYYLDAD
jgi:hypothetical protein